MAGSSSSGGGPLRRAASTVLYQPDLVPKSPLRTLGLPLYQRVFESGRTVPWVWSREQCQSFWAGQDDPDSLNHPSTYAGKRTAIVEFLHDFWRPQVEPSHRILELGPNAGTNLNHLHSLGYEDLSGVEINPAAIAEMESAYPEMKAASTIHQGAFEDVLPTLEEDSHDVVFSMAVLLHVHPTSHAIFDDIVRIARRYVCVIEAESVVVSYLFARNYRRVFERRGCPQVKSTLITQEAFPHLGEEYWGYTARLFRVGG